MMLSLILALMLSHVGSAALYPDPFRTPGATNPNITQLNINETICKKGWSTKSIRPSSSYTNKLKLQQMQELGIAGKPKDFEEDHLISLEIGGNPTDPANLWPQPYKNPGAHEKDKVENLLHREVCAGTITLAYAQKQIVTDWYAVYLSIQKSKKK